MRRFATALVPLALCLALPALAAKKNEAVVEGKIVDEEGTPLAGVAVTVSSPEDPGARAETTSDDKGRFRVEVAGASSDLIWSFKKEGHEPLITTLEISAGKRAQVDITLPSDTSEGAVKRRALSLYNEGVAAFNEGDKEKAKGLFQQAADADPSLAQARIALAEAAFQTDDPARALAAARVAQGLDPENLEARRLVLQSAQKLEDWDAMDAAADSLKGTELAPSVAVALYNLGVGALDAGDRDRAIRHFEKASEVDPSLAAPYSALATLRFNKQDYRGCLDALETYLAKNPDDVEALRLRFLAADALGDEALAAEARTAYEAAAPERAAAEGYERAETLFKNNQLDEARKALETILAADPNHLRANYTLGLCLLNSGDSAGARRQLQKVVELAPESQQGRDAKEMLQYIQ
ncbi:MAG: tetratricopeptide repeat protein [Acidobacteria bacterium]|nr:tetratricopeptide repeat protein [Acidobacteriota bacterium]